MLKTYGAATLEREAVEQVHADAGETEAVVGRLYDADGLVVAESFRELARLIVDHHIELTSGCWPS